MESKTTIQSNKSLRYLLPVMGFGLLLLSYQNHFNNAFHFDDIHTILNNTSIHSFKGWKYFTEGETFSILPRNRSYRPFTTFENAIDYMYSRDGSSTLPFHVHIFAMYTLLIVAVRFLFKGLLKHFFREKDYAVWSWLGAFVFALASSNSDVVNYIIQRAEITAALGVVLGVGTYLYGGIWRKYLLYLLFPLWGMLAKETAFTFLPLLGITIFFSLSNSERWAFFGKGKHLWPFVQKLLPSLCLTVGFLGIYVLMLPPTYSTGSINSLAYAMTQLVVFWHYIAMFVSFYHPTIDTDMGLFHSFWNVSVVISFIGYLAVLIFLLASKKNKTFIAIAWGTAWFMISLLPTSSFLPFSEVLNGHRSFLGGVGLSWILLILCMQGWEWVKAKSKAWKWAYFTILMGWFCFHSFSIHSRNKEWATEETLWESTVQSSPNNARARLNYGIALIQNGKLMEAQKELEMCQSIDGISFPLLVHQGRLAGLLGNVEQEFNLLSQALSYEPNNVFVNYCFGNFFLKEGNWKAAKKYFGRAFEIDPERKNITLFALENSYKWGDNDFALHIIRTLKSRGIQWEELTGYQSSLEEGKSYEEYQWNLAELRKDHAYFLEESKLRYEQRDFIGAIRMAKKAIAIDSNQFGAWNNLGLATIFNGDLENGIELLNALVERNPHYSLAKTNLMRFEDLRDIIDSLDGSLSLDRNLLIEKANKLNAEQRYKECFEVVSFLIEQEYDPGVMQLLCETNEALGKGSRFDAFCN